MTPWTGAFHASLSFTIFQSLLKLMSIELVMSSNHLILCCPLLLLPSVFPSIRVFSKNSDLCIRWPKYWSFSFSISPSNDDMGRVVGGGFRIGSSCILVVDSCQCMAKPIQYCKVKSKNKNKNWKQLKCPQSKDWSTKSQYTTEYYIAIKTEVAVYLLSGMEKIVFWFVHWNKSLKEPRPAHWCSNSVFGSGSLDYSSWFLCCIFLYWSC